jgi:hypothetical protein
MRRTPKKRVEPMMIIFLHVWESVFSIATLPPSSVIGHPSGRWVRFFHSLQAQIVIAVYPRPPSSQAGTSCKEYLLPNGYVRLHRMETKYYVD